MSADKGCGVTLPLSFKEPVSLTRVSRATATGFARSRLAPSTLTDRGASITLATGDVPRSSAEMLAPSRLNSRKSNFQGEAAGAAPLAGVAAPPAAVGATGGVGAAGGRAAADGLPKSLSRLSDPSGSSHVVNFRPVRDSESTWACRLDKSTVVPLT